MTIEKHYYVYLLTNWNNKVIYVGVTSDLKRRLFEHRNKLVYYETTTDVGSAIVREKEIKNWCREKKNRLVETTNSDWKDLSAVCG